MTSVQMPVQGLRFDARTWLEHGLVAVTGLFCGVVPEVGVAFASLCGVWGVWRFRERWGLRDLLISAFAVSHLVYALRSRGSVWVALLEALVMLLLPRAAWVLSPAFARLFGYLVLLGLCFPVGVALSRAFILDLDVWIIDPALARLERIGPVRKFTAVDASNAWALTNLGMQGPGTVEYEYQIRADHPVELIMSLIHPGLPGGRKDSVCQVRSEWSVCRIRALLPTPTLLLSGVGGYGRWKKGSSDVLIRSPHLRYPTARNPFERFRFISRQPGPSFNENAFGAWVVIMSFLALCALRNNRAVFLAIVPMFLAIYLSGSRGAMFSGVFGFITYFLIRFRFLRLLLPAILVALIGVFFMQTAFDVEVTAPVTAITAASPGLRAFELDTTAKQSRLKIWQEALRASLLVPIVGPLTLIPDAVSGPLRANAFDSLPHAHNLWLEMLIEGGLIQLAVMISLLGYLLFRLVNQSRILWITVLIAIVTVNFGDFIFYYAPIRLCFGLILGLYYTKEHELRSFNTI
jgi:hypothetical protein